MGTVTVQVVCVGGRRSMTSFYTFIVFFVTIQACFHLVGVICGPSVGNGI